MCRHYTINSLLFTNSFIYFQTQINRDIDLKRFAMCQGYWTENHRKAMGYGTDVKSHSALPVEGYITWAKQQHDPLYQINIQRNNNNNDKNNKILFIDICSSSSIN